MSEKSYRRLYTKTGEFFFLNGQNKLEPVKSNGAFAMFWVDCYYAPIIGWPVVFDNINGRIKAFTDNNIITFYGLVRSVIEFDAAANRALCWVQSFGTFPKQVFGVDFSTSTTDGVLWAYYNAGYQQHTVDRDVVSSASNVNLLPVGYFNETPNGVIIRPQRT